MNPKSPSAARVVLSFFTLLMALAGCSSVNTQVDNGTFTAHSFSFLNTSRPLPPYAEDRKQAHALVQQALISNLAARGVRHVTAGGDVTVAYLVIVGNNAVTTSLNEYFGYTPDAVALTDQVHEQETIKNTNRGYFEAGTLVIDFLEPGTSRLLQRRSIKAQVLRNLPMETRTARVQEIVDQALKDIPIAQ